MTNDFLTLVRFLERFDHEVEGRTQEEAPEEVRALLTRFARGQLAPAERDQLVRQLEGHPQWIASLVREVKALRPAPPAR